MKDYRCPTCHASKEFDKCITDGCPYWDTYISAGGKHVPKQFEHKLVKDPSRGVLNERGSTHGDFVENGLVMQELKEIMRRHWKWTKLEPYKREALEMIQHKIGRILCGDDNFYDHYRDIAGYAKLVEERLPKPEGK